MDSSKPSAQAIAWKGGRWRSGHGDGARGEAPARSYALRWLTKLSQRAREEAVGRWGTSGGVAGVEKQRGRAGVGYGDGGAARARRVLLRGRKAEATRKRSAAECGRALA